MGQIKYRTRTKGDVTRDDSQRRFLAQNSVATLAVFILEDVLDDQTH